MTASDAPQAMLSPYRVLDLTEAKGLYCGQMLGSLGADVIKIERPGGDEARNIGPFYQNVRHPERSLFWVAYNTNKRGITLDIAKPGGQEIFRRLVARADIVVESFAPGHLDKLGLGFSTLSALNPRIILTSISPFGQSGPYAHFKGSDLVGWAMGGLLYVTGDQERPPVRTSHIPFAYLMASMDAAWATAVALFWRGKSGRGQQIDVSVQRSIVKSAWMVREYFNVLGRESERMSSYYRVHDTDITLQVVWAAKDGNIRYMIFSGHFGEAENRRLVQWLEDEGLADDFIRGIDWPNLDWRYMPIDSVRRIEGYLARLFGSKTRAELQSEAFRRRIMLEPVLSPGDILKYPHLEARGYWQKVEHPVIGEARYPARFCLPSGTPCKLFRRAPLMGEHNEEVYQHELGATPEEVLTWKQSGVI